MENSLIKARINRVNNVIIRRAKNRNLIELDELSLSIFKTVLKIVKIQKFLKATYSTNIPKDIQSIRKKEFDKIVDMKKHLFNVFRTLTDNQVKRIAILMYTTQNIDAKKFLEESFKKHQKINLFKEYCNNAIELSEEFTK